MRALLLISVMLIAGCIDDPKPTTTAATNTTDVASRNLTLAAGAPFHAEGTFWVPPSEGQTPRETLFEVPVNASGMTAKATLYAGARYGPVESPTFWAQMHVELRDPAGTVVAEGDNNAFTVHEVVLEAADLAAGAYVLAILTNGGSDEGQGGGFGDYVDYTIDVA